MATMSMSSFLGLAEQFRPYHRVLSNLVLHFLTTPLAVAAVCGAANKLSGALTWVVAAAYVVHLSATVAPIVWLGTVASTVLVAVFAARLQRWTGPALLLAFCIGYFGQDAAHYFAGEPTFQSSYQQDADFWEKLVEHTYFLLPLLFDAALGDESPARREKPIVEAEPGIVNLLAVGAGSTTLVLWSIAHLGTAQKKSRAD